MNQKKSFPWSSAGRSHVGMVRAINEDACLVLPERGLWAVADGMGGHEAGDIASQMVIETLQQIEPPTSWSGFLQTVRSSLHDVNQRLREESAQRYHHRTIGSTVVVLIAYETQCACLWVGDSRIYRLRDGQLQQLTRDHSHVQELVDQGLIAPEEAHRHPLANVITRAVGAGQELYLDMDIVELYHGDMLLLCSDGVYKELSEQQINAIMSHGYSPAGIVQEMINACIEHGARDNVSAVVVKVIERV